MVAKHTDFNVWQLENESKVTVGFKQIIDFELPSYEAELIKTYWPWVNGDWENQREDKKLVSFPKVTGDIGKSINGYIDTVMHDEWYDQQFFLRSNSYLFFSERLLIQLTLCDEIYILTTEVWEMPSPKHPVD